MVIYLINLCERMVGQKRRGMVKTINLFTKKEMIERCGHEYPSREGT